VARAGEIAGEALVPRVAELIPGSEINTRQKNAGNEAQFERREQLDTQREGVEQKPEVAEEQGELRGQIKAQGDADAAARQQAALKQQADLAAQREKDAEASRTQTIGAAQDRQDKQFEQQNKLESQRQSEQEKLERERESASESKLDKTLAAKGDSSPFMRTLAENAAKDVATANGADFRWRSMNEAYPKALKGDQQAMVSLLTNHIGMTLGMQKGARITKDILNEAQKSTPWLQGVKAKFDRDGYLSGITLTPQQMEQMIGLAKDQRANAWQQVSDSARQAGVDKEAAGMIPKDLRSGGGGAGGIKIIRDANGRITEIQ
jgi:hypothetical protein